MQQYRLTVLAEADLDGIGEYSLERWGENQAVVYLTKLVNIFPGLKAGDFRFGSLPHR